MLLITLTPFCRDKTQSLGALGMSRSSALGCGLMDAIDHTYTLLSCSNTITGGSGHVQVFSFGSGTGMLI